MHISSRFHLQESWYKVAVCIYHQLFICRKIDIKFWYVYNYSILSGIHLQKSKYKVAVYISYHVVILRKVYIKLWNASIITCLPAGKLKKLRQGYIITCSFAWTLMYSCGLHISLGVHRRKSWYKVTVCIYYHVFICRKVDI